MDGKDAGAISRGSPAIAGGALLRQARSRISEGDCHALWSRAVMPSVRLRPGTAVEAGHAAEPYGMPEGQGSGLCLEDRAPQRKRTYRERYVLLACGFSRVAPCHKWAGRGAACPPCGKTARGDGQTRAPRRAVPRCAACPISFPDRTRPRPPALPAAGSSR